MGKLRALGGWESRLNQGLEFEVADPPLDVALAVPEVASGGILTKGPVGEVGDTILGGERLGGVGGEDSHRWGLSVGGTLGLASVSRVSWVSEPTGTPRVGWGDPRVGGGASRVCPVS